MSTIKANDIQNTSGGIPTVKGQKLIPTAWISYNGVTNVTRGSECVSSVTDVSTGQCRINFATTMADVNYCVTTNGARTTGSYIGTYYDWRTTSYVEIRSYDNGATTLEDNDTVEVVILGGQ